MRTVTTLVSLLCVGAWTAVGCTELRSGDEKLDAGDADRDSGAMDGGGDGGGMDGGGSDAGDAGPMDAGDAGATDGGGGDADAGFPCQFPTSGLVREYLMTGFRMSGGTDYYAVDTSPMAQDGEVHLPADGCTVELMTDRFGLGERAYKMGYNGCSLGVDQVYGVIRVPPVPISQEFTIALWLVSEVDGQPAFVAGQADYTQLDVQRSARKLGFTVKEDTADIKFEEPTEMPMAVGEDDLEDGPWTFYVAVVEMTDVADGGTGTTATLYRNGVVAGSGSAPRVFDNPNDGTPFFVGNLGDDMERMPYQGAMDDVRIYDRALSQCEVRRLCHEEGGGTGFDAPCPLPGE